MPFLRMNPFWALHKHLADSIPTRQSVEQHSQQAWVAWLRPQASCKSLEISRHVTSRMGVAMDGASAMANSRTPTCSATAQG